MGMKTKTIKQILNRKVKAWLDTIEDLELKKRCAKDVIVTGGSIASMLLGEKVNDFDIYFKTYEVTLAVTNYYVERFKKERKERAGVQIPITVDECMDVHGEPRIRIVVESAGVEAEGQVETYKYFEGRPPEETGDYVNEVYDDPQEIQDVLEETQENLDQEQKPPYRPIFLSTNAIMLANKVQLVIRFYGDPEKIHSNYDFVHCTNYFDFHDHKLVLKPDALKTLLSKTLEYQGSRYPVCSLFRIRKFLTRGWTINAGQILKIALQISQLDLHNYNVLEDQLTGVDVAYFQEILFRCKEEGSDTIESAYLVEIIDRMFGDLRTS